MAKEDVGRGVVVEVRVPIVREDASIWDDTRQHVAVLQPVDLSRSRVAVLLP